MDECLYFRTVIKCHHTQTAWLQAVQKHKYIPYFSLNIKWNILQSAQMEECWHCYFFYIFMRDVWDIETIALFWYEFSNKWCWRETIHIAFNPIEIYFPWRIILFSWLFYEVQYKITVAFSFYESFSYLFDLNWWLYQLGIIVTA